MKEFLELAAKWDRASGQLMAEANRLGPGTAGKIRATEAGMLRECAAELRQAIVDAQDTAQQG